MHAQCTQEKKLEIEQHMPICLVLWRSCAPSQTGLCTKSHFNLSLTYPQDRVELTLS